MAHYDEDSLLEYVQGTSPIAGEIDSHVTSCSVCAAEILERRELVSALSDPEVWESTPPPPRQYVANVTAFAARARMEDERATALCDEILTGPASWWRQRLRKSEGAYTAGMVKQLLERVRMLLSSSPANALQVTALAIEVANALDVTAYPSDYVVKLRAQGLRDHAYVLSFMGRYPEALDFVERSQRLFDQVPLPEYDLARLKLVKATVFQHIDRAEEGARLCHEAAQTFLRFGDESRYVGARMTEGSLFYSGRALERALETWESLRGHAALDEVGKVRLAHNLALCLTELGRGAEALEYTQKCIAQFEMLGMNAERTKSRWMLGNALMAAGKPEQAIPTLRQAWREFEELDIIGDAGMVALELAEALLACGQTEEVPAICRDVIAQFTRSGMASRAITALSFLREAVAIGQASTSLVRHVHAFLRELPAEQPRLFAPPPAGLKE